MQTSFRGNIGGFTLIELLVVVLIIGILSSVALPQYTKAVKRSRATEGLVAVKAIMEAEERVYLETGTYTTDLEALDVSFPEGKYFRLSIVPTAYYVVMQNKDDGYIFLGYLKNSDKEPGVVCQDGGTKTGMCKMLGYSHNGYIWEN